MNFLNLKEVCCMTVSFAKNENVITTFFEKKV